MRSAAPRLPSGRSVLVGVVCAYLGLLLVVPVITLIVSALGTGPSRMLAELVEPGALHALGQSVLLAAIAVAVNGVFGIAGAIVLVRHRFVGRWLVDALLDLSLAVSPVMTGLAFLLVFGRAGWLWPLVDWLGIRVAFAFPGLVLCTLFVTLPFTVREVSYVLAEIGTDDENAAATLGASAWQTFWHVTMPNIRHGLSLGTTLSAARALGEFGAVLVVGGAIAGHTQTATTFIYAASEERRDAASFGMALVLAFISVLLLLALQRLKHTTDPV